jgi:hypothetical protein
MRGTGSSLSGTIEKPALLGALGYYSGPTQTLPLLPGSLAIDQGAALPLASLSSPIGSGVTTLPVGDASAFAPGMQVVLDTGNNAETLTVASVDLAGKTLTVQTATLNGHNSGAGLFPATDQRGPGFARVVNGTVDIGAFETADFTLSYVSDDNQSATIGAAFPTPLAVRVTPNHAGDPVEHSLTFVVL